MSVDNKEPIDQEDGSQQDRQSAEPLRKAPAAQQSGEFGGHRDRRGHRQRRRKAQGRQRGSEEVVGRGCDQRDERRLIDIAESRMPAADDEIELIAEDAVAGVEGNVKGETRRAENYRRRRRSPSVRHSQGRFVVVPGHDLPRLWRESPTGSYHGRPRRHRSDAGGAPQTRTLRAQRHPDK
jgi:hypothetical protein